MFTAVIAFLALGAIAGVLAGLLGVGGGLVLVAALVWLLPTLGIPQEAAMHAALASSLASIVLTATASARAHARRGSVMWPTVAWMVPGLLLGGWLGSGIAVRVDDDVLRYIVAGYCFLAALQLLLGGTRKGVDGNTASPPRGAPMSLAGVVIGAVSAVVGIGGGSMTVPLLVWRGVAPVHAVATSSACGVAIGLSAACSYASAPGAIGMPDGSLGYVFLPAALGTVLTSLPMAPLGARLAHRIDGATLKRIFAGFLATMALMLATT